jgi:hypothetical protein
MVLSILFVTSAFGAGGGSGTTLSDEFNLGDIRGYYSTSSYSGTDGTLYASFGGYLEGEHKINNASLSFQPNWWYSQDENGDLVKKQKGYLVSMYVGGVITTPLTLSDLGDRGQSSRFTARGIDISENTYINTFKQYGTDELLSGAGSSINIMNFAFTSAQGNYNEHTYGGGDSGKDLATSFNWQVICYGDFLPGKGPTIAFTGMTTSVPEPTSICMLLGLAIFGGVIFWRKR